MELLKGKVALITGAGRGIGKAIAEKFAAEGAMLALTDIKISDQAKAFEQEMNAKGIKTKYYECDASDFEKSVNITKEIKADFGRIDILVNNAGITRDTLLLKMTEDQWDLVLKVNLKSVFCMTKAVLQEAMLGQRAGSIINMSSVVGVSGNASQCNYSASKAGIIGFTKSVAKEYGKRGIRSNAVAPGFIISDMTNALSEEVRKEWVKSIPLQRGGTPEDVANVCTFLSSDLSSYVTGQVIHCCGGMNM